MSIVEKGTTHAIVKFLTAKPDFETVKTKRTVCKFLSGLIAAIITILVEAFILLVAVYFFEEVLKIKGNIWEKTLVGLFFVWLYLGYKIFRWIFCLINELGLKRIYRTYIDMYAEEIITSVEVSKEQLESFREDCIKWL